jgi:hypothetical protein
MVDFDMRVLRWPGESCSICSRSRLVIAAAWALVQTTLVRAM